MSDCIFCNIISKEVPAKFIFEDSDFVVFEDINPQAPIHLLIVTKKHYKDLVELPNDNWVKLQSIILELARKKEVLGFRLINNAGNSAAIGHFHLHFMGGLDSKESLV